MHKTILFKFLISNDVDKVKKESSYRIIVFSESSTVCGSNQLINDSLT